MSDVPDSEILALYDITVLPNATDEEASDDETVSAYMSTLRHLPQQLVQGVAASAK